MAARFTVLASGSSGNASLLQADGLGVLLDFGLGPRAIASRLAVRGLSWQDVHAALLTHTHTDHWNEHTFAYLGRLQIPLYCHPSHADALTRSSESFLALHAAGFVRTYESGHMLSLGPALHGLPLLLSHDAIETFGLRFEGGRSLFGTTWALGYAADLGCWNEEVAQALTDVDLLALEFNHDEQMQLSSGRPYTLIQRVLGDAGHLSNRQAGELLRIVLKATRADAIRHIVPLHLSRQCNRPDLARAAALEALTECGATGQIVVTSAAEPTPTLALGPEARRRRHTRRSPPPARGDVCA